MKHLYEYRHFKFKKNRGHKPNVKNDDEPFFNIPKRKYFDKKYQDDKNRYEEDRKVEIEKKIVMMRMKGIEKIKKYEDELEYIYNLLDFDNILKTKLEFASAGPTCGKEVLDGHQILSYKLRLKQGYTINYNYSCLLEIILLDETKIDAIYCDRDVMYSTPITDKIRDKVVYLVKKDNFM